MYLYPLPDLLTNILRIFEYLDKDEDGLVAVEDLVNYFEDANIELGKLEYKS